MQEVTMMLPVILGALVVGVLLLGTRPAPALVPVPVKRNPRRR
jgi:hypothetical protein